MVQDVRIDTIAANLCYVDAPRLAPQRCVRATDVKVPAMTIAMTIFVNSPAWRVVL
jgi:hypothetical protein